MGRVSIEDAEKYKSTGSWFSLKDDKDTEKIRFMYNDANDIQLFVVHEEEIGGKKRFINCLRSYDEPVSNCPLCAKGSKQTLKMFVPVYNESKKEVQFWQRGKTFAAQLAGFAGRYKPLVGQLFEVERQGKKGDTGTRYQFYPLGQDKITLDDLPEIPTVMGGIVLDKTFDELQNGSYSEDEAVVERASEAIPTRRRQSSVPY